jgi:hypothetical protein
MTQPASDTFLSAAASLRPRAPRPQMPRLVPGRYQVTPVLRSHDAIPSRYLETCNLCGGAPHADGCPRPVAGPLPPAPMSRLYRTLTLAQQIGAVALAATGGAR